MKIYINIATILLILFIIYVFIINAFLIGNAASHMLMCENTLEMIADASNQYRANSDGQWAPSLVELEPYYKGKYKPDPNNVPKCPGDRNESTSEYYYFKPLSQKVVPFCWDSKPHRTKGFILSDTFLWTVLYSDGHVERVNKKELFKELSSLSKTNPDVLKVLPNFTGQNNEDEK